MSLTEYIKRDLIAGFQSGEFQPRRLTLVKLSERYQVSVTPVRAAVKQLVSEGYLEQQSNRRLIVRRDHAKRVGSDALAAKPPADWYRTVANDLIRLSLSGQSPLMREHSTAKKYGISRSSIRQIFNRLAGEDVLQHIPRCGWRLRAFRPTDLDAYTDVRVSLEVLALDDAWPRLVDDDLEAMLAGNVLPVSQDESPLIDNRIHEYLVEKAGNPYISSFFARHSKYYDALFHWIGMDRALLIQVVHDHWQIIEALLRRDRPGAAQALVAHIRRNQPFLKRRMQHEFPGGAVANSGGADANRQ